MSEVKARFLVAILIIVGTHVIAAGFATFTPLSFSEALSSLTLGILAIITAAVVYDSEEESQ
jgi:hypothetical protein